MCGIVGYTGEEAAQGILIAGLERLEYRGYDSAGVAISDGDELQVVCRKRESVPARAHARAFRFRGNMRHRTYALGDARQAERG